MDALVEVRFSDCRCEGAPHPDGDIAYLRPFLDFAGGSEALRMLAQAASEPTRIAELVGPVYLRRGLVGWNRVDAEGNPVPIPDDPATALPYQEAYWIADKADDLYGTQVLAPLAERTRKSSQPGPTAASTSARKASRSSRPARSGRSSPAS